MQHFLKNFFKKRVRQKNFTIFSQQLSWKTLFHLSPSPIFFALTISQINPSTTATQQHLATQGWLEAFGGLRKKLK